MAPRKKTSPAKPTPNQPTPTYVDPAANANRTGVPQTSVPTQSAGSDAKQATPRRRDLVRWEGHDGATAHGIVTDTVTESRDDNGDVLRAAGVYVVPTSEPVFVALDALKQD